MDRSVKSLLILIIIGISIFLCIIFLPFILKYILKPFSVFVWFLLRIFILSIHQKIIWGIAIWIIILIFVIRIKGIIFINENNSSLDDKVYLKNFDLWRYYFILKPHRSVEMKFLKQKLLQMLVSVYASKKRISVNNKIYDDFKNKEIELPLKLYSFLFEEERKNKWFNYKKIMQRISGKGVKNYYKNIEEYFNYLENYLDIDSTGRAIQINNITENRNI